MTQKISSRNKSLWKALTVATMFALALFTVLITNAQSVFPPQNGGESVTLPVAHFKLTDTKAPGVGGKTKIEAIDVFGKGATGQHGTFVHFDEGFVSKLHSHTYDMYGIVIKGQVQNYEVGVTPVTMSPGGYWYQKGKTAHTTTCVGKGGCLVFVVQSGKNDNQIPPIEN